MVVRNTRYGFTGVDVAEAEDEFVVEAAATVEALAMPRKWLSVEGRGRAIGRRNGSVIEKAMFNERKQCSIVREFPITTKDGILIR